MKNKLPSPLAQIAFIFLFSLFLMGSIENYTVTGVLVDDEEIPVIGHKVMLYNFNGIELTSDTTDSEGAFSLLYDTSPVFSDENIMHDGPSDYILGAAYPNPFNPQTTIPFYSPQKTQARIAIYNVLGQEVMGMNTSIAKGVHHIQVNLGSHLSQGSYLLHVQGPGFSKTRTMTFISAGIGGKYTGIRVNPAPQNAIGSFDAKKTQPELSAGNYRIVVDSTGVYQRMEVLVPSNQDYDAGTLTLLLKGHFLRDIDGNIYETVQIGEQTWMAENLRTSFYANGDEIIHEPDESEWSNLDQDETGAWVVFNNENENNAIYGKLYNWYAVDDERGLCPVGWKIPSDEEWKILEMFLGMTEDAANRTAWRGGDENISGKMRITGIEYWRPPNDGASNESGFSGMPGGYRSETGGFFEDRSMGHWWSSSEQSGNFAWSRFLYYNNDSVFRFYHNKKEGLSVRCILE